MLAPVEPVVFSAMRAVDVDTLASCSETQIRPVLPCLVRMSLIAPLDQSVQCVEKRKTILCLLSSHEVVNSLVALLSVNFSQLESEVVREQQLRAKNSSSADSILLPGGLESAVSEFERSEALQKLRIVLAPIVTVMAHVRRSVSASGNGDTLSSQYSSAVTVNELLENSIHLEEVADVLCVALAELPHLLSPVEVCAALLHVKHGSSLVCRLVANMPDCMKEVCSSLVTAASADEDTPVAMARSTTLRQLCAMCPSHAAFVRDHCVRLCRLPSLVITLTLSGTMFDDEDEEGGDLVAFLSGLLLGENQSVRVWLQNFVRLAQKRKCAQASVALQSMRAQLSTHVQHVLISMSAGPRIRCRTLIEASALVRLYCALRGIAGLKFSDDELSLLLQLVTCRPPVYGAGVQLAMVSLCALVGCPSLLAVPEHERLAGQWLQWLARQERFFESNQRGNSGGESCGQMLLLLASHFHSNNVASVMELVSNTLGMRLNTRHTSVARVKHIFTQDVFTEQAIASHAVKVRVTRSLSARVPGTLPIHCIDQLLKSRTLNKHRIPVADWIFSQLCQSCAPLHSALPSLIENFVKALVDACQHTVTSSSAVAHSANGGNSGFSRLDESKISALFTLSIDGGEGEVDGVTVLEPVTAQLLVLYYMLLYEDRRLASGSGSMGSRRLPPYRSQLINSLPTALLLEKAQAGDERYVGLYAPLLALVYQHYPQLCLVGQWMSAEIAAAAGDITKPPANSIRRRKTLNNDLPSFVDVAERSMMGLPESSVTCSNILRKLSRWPLHADGNQLWLRAEPLVRNARCLLRQGVPRYVQHQFGKLWSRLSGIHAVNLFTATANALRRPMAPPLTAAQMVHEPLTVLRCDERVFRSPPLLAIVLRILAVQLASSRAHLQRHLLQLTPSNPAEGASAASVGESELEELRGALLLTQESAVVQILAEVCLTTAEDRENPGGKELLQEVRSLVCSHIHQAFIETPMLAKLVHFQGYPAEALPVLVAGVPSMHICLDFVPELLSQPNTEKQTFAVLLTSQLALQFPIARCVAVSRLVVSVLTALLATLSDDTCTRLFITALPTLSRLVHAFRPLAEDVVPLLLQLASVTKCRLQLLDGTDNGSCRLLLTEVRSTFKHVCQAVLTPGDVF